VEQAETQMLTLCKGLVLALTQLALWAVEKQMEMGQLTLEVLVEVERHLHLEAHLELVGLELLIKATQVQPIL
jgi:uncharacterized membrane protein (DUF2068 family)